MGWGFFVVRWVIGDALRAFFRDVRAGWREVRAERSRPLPGARRGKGS
jgi:hypothetical protein